MSAFLSNALLRAADYLSVLPLALHALLLYQYGMTQKSFYLHVSALLLLSDVSVKCIKRALVATFPRAQCFRRPIGCANTDYLSRNGPQHNAPGFPSGHMTSVVLFACFLIDRPEFNTSSSSFRVALTLVSLTAFCRLYKRVHTPLQVLSGGVYGAILYFAFFRFV